MRYPMYCFVIFLMLLTLAEEDSAFEQTNQLNENIEPKEQIAMEKDISQVISRKLYLCCCIISILIPTFIKLEPFDVRHEKHFKNSV